MNVCKIRQEPMGLEPAFILLQLGRRGAVIRDVGAGLSRGLLGPNALADVGGPQLDHPHLDAVFGFERLSDIVLESEPDLRRIDRHTAFLLRSSNYSVAAGSHLLRCSSAANRSSRHRHRPNKT